MTSPPAAPSPAHAAHRVLWGLLALVASEGLLGGWAAGVGGRVPPDLSLAYTLAQAALVYAWWRADAAQPTSLHPGPAPRPLWLSGLVIALPVLGVPLHLWRSRPAEQRLRALGRALGYVLALASAYLLAGAPLAYWLGGT